MEESSGWKRIEGDFWKFWLIMEISPPQSPSFPFIPLIPKQAPGGAGPWASPPWSALDLAALLPPRSIQWHACPIGTTMHGRGAAGPAGSHGLSPGLANRAADWARVAPAMEMLRGGDGRCLGRSGGAWGWQIELPPVESRSTPVNRAPAELLRASVSSIHVNRGRAALLLPGRGSWRWWWWISNTGGGGEGHWRQRDGQEAGSVRAGEEQR
jgi:hypothetical protein